ncbi:hypothetical protein SAMN04489760_11659 [Syntrophus gentianae]|uniref:VWFA domain-containing protein n=1 Tax=Syntrophus gentianae TaxID=43775 RepID=A0A1H7YH39_9BACT|nr:DUF444 family protein [Syntrophus gentianae]SEM45576.1 hypothetical protein SAMN04489760_11659 [Syntrophus gentianae]
MTLPRSLYSLCDMTEMQDVGPAEIPYSQRMTSIGDLLERDTQREKDGFPRKIRIGRLFKPTRGEKEKIVVVPTTVEEKLMHDTRPPKPEEESDAGGGSGEGEEGDIIGQEPLHGQEGAGTGSGGQGEGVEHEMEAGAYELGRILTEQFELPNLKNKGMKRSLKKVTYDLTDRNEGFGQVLDKKATLRKILETNIALENIPDVMDIDLASLIVSPADSVYRILSQEKDLESQALVFFVRDYSGSMSGKPTELVVSQHVLIYSWLLYQYDRQLLTRFILHDTEAKEVPDFHSYASLKIAGGTKMGAAYRLINSIVEKDNLDRDYNIYVFHGTDGDDWDREGKETIPVIQKMIRYCSRIGITITAVPTATGPTWAEAYLRDSKVLEEFPQEIKLDVVSEDAEESRLIDGIKKLIS